MLTEIITLFWIMIKIVAIYVALMISVAYLTLAERKVLAFMQVRVGPNRVGFKGLLQPFADLFKMLFKEVFQPTASNKFLFVLAPLVVLIPSFSAWAVIPFGDQLVLANANAGLLYILAMTSLGVYGILIAGWASNSKYAMFGAMRSCAQIISYEIAMGFALIGVLMAAGTTNLSGIVLAQSGSLWHWYFIPLFPLFVVYFISGVAETNRAPFDVSEGETEIVAGYHVEYSGSRFALFFLSEYASMILISLLASLLFMGGWLSPFQGISFLETLFAWVPGIVWLFAKTAFFLFLYLWFRATFPRYRYDQIMRLGWKILIPVTLVWIIVVAIAVQFKVAPWFV